MKNSFTMLSSAADLVALAELTSCFETARQKVRKEQCRRKGEKERWGKKKKRAGKVDVSLF